jgi:ribonucleoside-diphosphate reductase alpha chain
MHKNRLPDERRGITKKLTIDGRKIYIQTGEYLDGKLGEVFISLDKEGSELRVYDVLATVLSVALQHGVPLKVFTDKLKNQKMEPAGITQDNEIPLCHSISDYLGKWLEKKYLSPENRG